MAGVVEKSAKNKSISKLTVELCADTKQFKQDMDAAAERARVTAEEIERCFSVTSQFGKRDEEILKRLDTIISLLQAQVTVVM